MCRHAALVSSQVLDHQQCGACPREGRGGGEGWRGGVG